VREKVASWAERGRKVKEREGELGQGQAAWEKREERGKKRRERGLG